MYNRTCWVTVLLLCLAAAGFGQTDPGNRDTVRVEAAATMPGQDVVVNVSVYNDELLGGLTVPLVWSSSDITLDSVSFVGTRVEYVNNKPKTIYNATQKVVFGAVVFFEDYIPTGDGIVGKLYFHVPGGIADQYVTIDSTTILPAARLLLTKENGSGLMPVMLSGRLKIGNPTLPPHIALSESSMSFEGKIAYPDPESRALIITNTGEGTMTWSTTHSKSWLSVNPPSGTAPSITSIHASITGLPVGTYYDTIVVSAPGANNTPQRLPVTLSVVTMPPTIRYSPSQFTVSAIQGGANPENRKLAITTDVPGSILNWTVTNSSGWLTLAPTAGTPPDSVTLQFDITGLAYGTYRDTIVISDPRATNNPQRVPVKLDIVSDLPVLDISPDTLYVLVPAGTTAAPAIFRVLNSGGGTMTYNASESSSIIMTVNPANGTAPQDVTLTFKTLPLSPGDYYETVTVTSPEAVNSPQTLVVFFHVTTSPASMSIFPTSISFSYYECWQGPDAVPPYKTFQVLNSGQDPMPWSLTHSQDWLLVSDTEGVNGKIIGLALNADGMPVGTYYDTVVVSSDFALNSPKRLRVTLNVVPGPQPPELSAVSNIVNLPTQEVFGMHMGSLASLATVINLQPGCMDYYTQENIPWLRIMDSVGSAPGELGAVVDVGSYTYGEYLDSFWVYSPGAVNSPVKLYVNMQVYRYNGDANWDNKVDVADVVYLICYLFRDGPLPMPTPRTGDANCDAIVTVGDAVHLINFLFKGGDPPCGNP